jgi:hypothetical protein
LNLLAYLSDCFLEKNNLPWCDFCTTMEKPMRFITYIFILLLFLLISGSCGKIEQLPSVPQIEFRNFTVFDTIDLLGNHSKGARLQFYFKDGDGDLGLNPPSRDQADTTNLFLTLYRKKAGEMVPALSNDPLFPSGYRIPYMERLGQNKILKGTVTITLVYSFYTPHDTIMYEFKIKDRAGNESNTASTCEIVLSRNGGCNTP